MVALCFSIDQRCVLAYCTAHTVFHWLLSSLCLYHSPFHRILKVHTINFYTCHRFVSEHVQQLNLLCSGLTVKLWADQGELWSEKVCSCLLVRSQLTVVLRISRNLVLIDYHLQIITQWCWKRQLIGLPSPSNRAETETMLLMSVFQKREREARVCFSFSAAQYDSLEWEERKGNQLEGKSADPLPPHKLNLLLSASLGGSKVSMVGDQMSLTSHWSAGS